MMIILVIDRSKQAAELTANMIYESDKTPIIYRAHNYREVNFFLIEVEPDVVFLDSHFLKSSTIQMLQSIKFINPKVKIFVLYKNADELYLQNCKAMGADFLFDKCESYAGIAEEIRSIKHNRIAPVKNDYSDDKPIKIARTA